MARQPTFIKNRPTSTRTSKPKVLIVCEGSKTEPDYLNLLKKEYHLASVVIIMPSVGSAPISVVKSANTHNQEQIKLYGESAAYEVIYCVYDTDAHTSLNEASDLANKYKFKKIISNPCFEYWLLLHFKYSRSPILPNAKKTVAQKCQEQLTKFLPDYQKNDIQNYFKELLTKIAEAISNSKRSYSDAIVTSESNPSTNMHELVEFLQSL